MLIFIRRKSFPKKAIPRLAMVERLNSLARRISRDDKGYARTEAWRALNSIRDATRAHDWMVAARLSSAGVVVSKLTAGGFLQIRGKCLFLALLVMERRLFLGGHWGSSQHEHRRNGDADEHTNMHIPSCERHVAGSYIHRHW